MSADRARRLARLAELGRQYGVTVAEIRRLTAELLAEEPSWGQVAATLGCSREALRTKHLDWGYYRQLNRVRNRQCARPALLTLGEVVSDRARQIPVAQ